MSVFTPRRSMVAAVWMGLFSSSVGAVEYVPVGEPEIRSSLASIASGQWFRLVSGNADQEVIARARAAAANCDLGRISVQNQPGISFAQVNLDCSPDESVGFLFVFLEGKLKGVEIYSGGINLVVPPASPTSGKRVQSNG